MMINKISNFRPYKLIQDEPAINKKIKIEDQSITLPLNIFQQLVEKAKEENQKKEDTKNLLRNFGNALNRFILNNEQACKIIKQYIPESSVPHFKKWVTNQKLENFEQFKRIWTVDDDVYKKIFSELSFEFYSKYAYSYVMHSQMRSESTKLTHLKYITRFLEGIVSPETFYYFKK
ncbi:unnamed protein product [Paramecium octaurelia]|uniref:Uncharacterized protein n=1 Tax=Paramecium octaurelia TaxID=43137 RepID=A0A8S1TDW2_PAROT|nr:unnamed protein product [Paramecium octaurelia]